MIDPKTIMPNECKTEEFYSNVAKKNLVEWNYRDASGKLYAGVVDSMDKVDSAIAKKIGLLPY